jgi:hypothetical protein
MNHKVSTVLSHFNVTSKQQHYEQDCVKHHNGGHSLSRKAERTYRAIYRSLSLEEKFRAIS